MLNSITTVGISVESFLIIMFTAIVLGIVVSVVHNYTNHSSKGFHVTLAVLPAVVSMVILLVNGNLGAGVAVAGAFSLIRFRSLPGTAKEITSIFIAMAIGLACGMGYVGIAGIFVVIVGIFMTLLTVTKFGENKYRKLEKELRITIPESLDYTEIFDDIFLEFTSKVELEKVKTSNMGSLYKLQYRIQLKDDKAEKKLMDEIRCRNGNLEVMCGRVSTSNEEL